jgi:hypothetical protein
MNRTAQIAPMQQLIHAIALAIVYGCRATDQIRASFRTVTAPIVKSIGVGVPVAVVFAQNFLPGPAGLSFMRLVSFAVNSSINAGYKKNRHPPLRGRRSYDDYSITSDDPNGEECLDQSE